jgi:hypothetical protein
MSCDKYCTIKVQNTSQAILADARFDEHIQGGQHYEKFKAKLINSGIS